MTEEKEAPPEVSPSEAEAIFTNTEEAETPGETGISPDQNQPSEAAVPDPVDEVANPDGGDGSEEKPIAADLEGKEDSEAAIEGIEGESKSVAEKSIMEPDHEEKHPEEATPDLVAETIPAVEGSGTAIEPESAAKKEGGESLVETTAASVKDTPEVVTKSGRKFSGNVVSKFKQSIMKVKKAFGGKSKPAE